MLGAVLTSLISFAAQSPEPSASSSAPVAPGAPPAASASAAPAAPEAPPAKPAPAATRAKVIVLDLKGASSTPEDLGVLSALVAAALSEFGSLEVMSGADVRGIATLEAEKQQLGCDTNAASCLSEIAGALGARVVVFGELSALGRALVLNVSLFDSEKQTPAGRFALQGDTIEEIAAALPAAVAEAAIPFLEREALSTARGVARRVAPKLPKRSSGVDDDQYGGLRVAGAITGLSAGALLLAGHGVLLAATSGGAYAGDVMEAMRLPIVGPFVAADVEKRFPREENEGGAPLAATGAIEAALGAVALGGGVMWTLGVVGDGPELDVAGNAWRWGLVGGGVACVAGGLAIDAASPTSANHRSDALDYVPPALYVVGGVAPLVGLLTNPFVVEEANE